MELKYFASSFFSIGFGEYVLYFLNHLVIKYNITYVYA